MLVFPSHHLLPSLCFLLHLTAPPPTAAFCANNSPNPARPSQNATNPPTTPVRMGAIELVVEQKANLEGDDVSNKKGREGTERSTEETANNKSSTKRKRGTRPRTNPEGKMQSGSPQTTAPGLELRYGDLASSENVTKSTQGWECLNPAEWDPLETTSSCWCASRAAKNEVNSRPRPWLAEENRARRVSRGDGSFEYVDEFGKAMSVESEVLLSCWICMPQWSL
jgi:hypothetical protein